MLTMFRAFRYQIVPTRAQERTLIAWLDALHTLYNAMLAIRRDSYRTIKRLGLDEKAPTHLELIAALADVRETLPAFAAIPLVALRGTVRQLDKALKAFFRRCKEGETPGFPRFKGYAWFHTIAIDDIVRLKIVCGGGKRLSVPFIGKVKLRMHRDLCGTPKALRITRDNGRWFVSIQCDDVPLRPLAATGRDVGIDLGISTLIATSDGDKLPNIHPLDSAQASLTNAQRRLSKHDELMKHRKRTKWSQRRKRLVRVIAKGHAHVRNVRRENHITNARKLVAKYDVIYHEKLNMRGLTRSRLARAIHDAAWGEQLHWIRVKAEEAAREAHEVDARGTSIDCSGCGVKVPKDLSVRIHRCPSCGLTIDRDVNAARNVLARGTRDRREARDKTTSMTRNVRVVANGGAASCPSRSVLRDAADAVT